MGKPSSTLGSKSRCASSGTGSLSSPCRGLSSWRSLPSRRPKSAFQAWYKKQARAVLTERAGYFARKHGFEIGKIRITSARTRWGSCSTKKTLSFTWRLVMAPPEVVDYVVVHELCHLRELNHSRAFWAQVEAILPDYKGKRKWLKENGNLLVL